MDSEGSFQEQSLLSITEEICSIPQRLFASTIPLRVFLFPDLIYIYIYIYTNLIYIYIYIYISDREID